MSFYIEHNSEHTIEKEWNDQSLLWTFTVVLKFLRDEN